MWVPSMGIVGPHFLFLLVGHRGWRLFYLLFFLKLGMGSVGFQSLCKSFSIDVLPIKVFIWSIDVVSSCAFYLGSLSPGKQTVATELHHLIGLLNCDGGDVRIMIVIRYITYQPLPWSSILLADWPKGHNIMQLQLTIACFPSLGIKDFFCDSLSSFSRSGVIHSVG
jgi:hypothetical protein